ncbi:hypothetical protein E4U45_005986 [Claviceps purpurea]|nr:hypothetical protein E4U45_005986 [Claviceps purpurea]
MLPARAIALRATAHRPGLIQNHHRLYTSLTPLPGQVRRYTPHQHQQQLTHQPGQIPDNITISWTHEHILLQHQDHQKSTLPPRRLHAATLRDECSCPTCRDESSGNKTFASVEIPPEIRIVGVRAREDGLGIQFANDVVRFEGRHETVVPWERVERVVFSAASYWPVSESASSSSSSSSSFSSSASSSVSASHSASSSASPFASSTSAAAPAPAPTPASPRGRRPNSLFHRKQALLARTGVQYWDASTLSTQIRKIDYHAFMASSPSSSSSSSSSSYSPAFWDVLITLLRLGIVYLTHVPRHESSLPNIINHLANLRETFYGRTFDVRAKPHAENVAYTSGYLGLHQDLCYLAPPPMIQVLHCMDNSCEGGESLFSDGERVGRLLWPFVRRGRGGSNKMGVLAEHAVPYQYDKHGYYYRAERSVLRREADGSFGGVYWSPPFQGRYEQQEYGGEEVDLKRWIPAARVFEGLVNDPGAVFRYKMQEGECVLFDNLRVLHGRNAFDAAHRGGSRWLRGGYIAAEDFLSRAAYIPGERADEHRGEGDLWTPEGAEEELRGGDWWSDVVRRVREVDEAGEV